jgi:phospholipid/cholesterol/gamma-HCH transport system ATP-binding protein
MTDRSVIIEMIDVHKSFGENHVLQGVNLQVLAGESMVVIGGSGTGKSVILKHIIGLLRPDSGRILIEGNDLEGLSEEELSEIRRKFGMLFQGAALFDSLSVWENVGFALRYHTKLNDTQVRAIATEKLSMVGLKEIEDRMPAELSGGMKKRVGLARAIATEPKILLYDEPTTGLDPIMADVINDLICELKQRLSVSSVAITHDMKSAYKIADRIAMLYQGKIEEVGTPDEIRESKNPIVQQFITGSAVGPISIR